MKGLAESSPFHLLTNPHMINRFIFGHGVVIYYLHCSENEISNQCLFSKAKGTTNTWKFYAFVDVYYMCVTL